MAPDFEPALFYLARTSGIAHSPAHSAPRASRRRLRASSSRGAPLARRCGGARHLPRSNRQSRRRYLALRLPRLCACTYCACSGHFVVVAAAATPAHAHTRKSARSWHLLPRRAAYRPQYRHSRGRSYLGSAMVAAARIVRQITAAGLAIVEQAAARRSVRRREEEKKKKIFLLLPSEQIVIDGDGK